ncbi:endonuclease/exonuclease/phosphatase family protein [Dactylosporangium fulvum]|uniref:Endonuclease/exonuclease/phosphatase family protein n=1 Tax=Dactylosporangium fulvum TaxID=53359 RepID=A0ABY5VLU0_9ACTN|nr:endonuclease/exonuclease/phosphatase family protein [Dactylosporangium fulvum]UWP78473.1 endonuclease/exonuclease/phosphatase family protein [Dactylosporangium fulvum]
MAVLWWVIAVLVAGFALVRLTGAERGTPLVQLLAYTPYAAVAALLAGAAAALDGAWAPAAVCLAGGAILAAVVVPRLMPGRRAGAGVRLRVMTANLLYDRGDVRALLEQAKVDDVDVLALQELSRGALEELDRAGVGGLLPFRSACPKSRGFGSAVFSRHPIVSDPGHEPVRRLPSGVQQAMATVLVPGAGPVLVESAHPCAPHPGRTGGWARDLAAQPPAGSGPAPRVLLGDFNSTLDHGPLRRLLRTGYRDAAAGRGRGLLPTWPFRGATRLLRLLPVTIDHVLVDRRIGVRAVATRVTPGSDHRAVVAELTIPMSYSV